MNKPNLLVVCPPDHYLLRNLAAIREQANTWVGNDTVALSERAPSADILLVSGLTGGAVDLHEVWRHTKHVCWVHSLSAGVEKLLIPEIVASDVPVTNARGVFKRSLAEFAIYGILYFYKRGRRLVESQRSHQWDDFKVDWMIGKTFAVVGYGEIGRECATLAHAMGMKVHAVRRRPEQSENDPIVDKVFSLDELPAMLAGADVVLAAAPLTPQTRHMLSDRQFAQMKPSAIVMNVGRGPVIDEAALERALKEKKIAGAALDVFEEEPLPENHPFWDMENVLISPHCTDRTADPDWLDLTMQFFVQNFERFIHGQPLLNVVDKKAGY